MVKAAVGPAFVAFGQQPPLGQNAVVLALGVVGGALGVRCQTPLRKPGENESQKPAPESPEAQLAEPKTPPPPATGEPPAGS
jgi:hypothetical protein